MTEAFTTHTELAATWDKKADTVAKSFLETWICRHWVHAIIVSDRGKEFLNATMKKLYEFTGMDFFIPSSVKSSRWDVQQVNDQILIQYAE